MKPHFVPSIEKSCPVKWDSLIGDEKRRYCEHCQLHVHNLSAMTTSERDGVLAPGAEPKCIRYLTRADSNAPEGKARLMLQSLSWLPRWLAAIVAIFSSSCVQQTMGAPMPPPPSNSAKNPHAETAL